MPELKSIIAALDQLISTLRSQQEVRLASVLHHHVHRAAFSNQTALLAEVSRLLRHAQASQVSSYSAATSTQINDILAAIVALD